MAVGGWTPLDSAWRRDFQTTLEDVLFDTRILMHALRTGSTTTINASR